jgi:hypothetical protein
MSNLPTTAPAQRIAKLFHRKLTTPWTDKEIRRYRQLYKLGAFNDLSDLLSIERYYAAERKKGSDGIHRRDLYTFLNNFSGELDRARAREKRLEGIRSERAKERCPDRPPELTDEQIERNRAVMKEEIEKLRAKMRLPECERTDYVPPVVKDALKIFNGTVAI